MWLWIHHLLFFSLRISLLCGSALRLNLKFGAELSMSVQWTTFGFKTDIIQGYEFSGTHHSFKVKHQSEVIPISPNVWESRNVHMATSTLHLRSLTFLYHPRTGITSGGTQWNQDFFNYTKKCTNLTWKHTQFDRYLILKAALINIYINDGWTDYV